MALAAFNAQAGALDTLLQSVLTALPTINADANLFKKCQILVPSDDVVKTGDVKSLRLIEQLEHLMTAYTSAPDGYMGPYPT